MTVEGHKAKIEHNPEIDMFQGEILGLNGGADFYGKTPDELRLEFKKSLKVFLEVCTEKGKSSLFRKRPDGLIFQHSAKFSIFFF